MGSARDVVNGLNNVTIGQTRVQTGAQNIHFQNANLNLGDLYYGSGRKDEIWNEKEFTTSGTKSGYSQMAAYHDGINHKIGFGFENLKGHRNISLDFTRSHDHNVVTTMGNSRQRFLQAVNPMVYGDSNNAVAYFTNNSENLLNAQNGGTTGVTTKVTYHYGGSVGFDLKNKSTLPLAHAGIEKVTTNIIPVDGMGVNVSGGAGYASATVYKYIGLDTDGNKLGATSEKMTNLKLGLTVNTLGLPLMNTEFGMVRDGFLRKVDPLAMLNAFNLMGAITAWGNAFSLTKMEVPRFELNRHNDHPNPVSHANLFNDKQTILTREGDRQLRDLVENVKKNLTSSDAVIELQIGRYHDDYKREVFTSYSEKDVALSNQRQEIVEKRLLEIAAEMGVPPSQFKLSKVQENTNPNDKRLNILDNNTNIKIVSNTPNLNLVDSKYGLATFNAIRVSPEGEKKFLEIQELPDFEKFVKDNKLSKVEREMLANAIFNEIHIKQVNVEPTTIMQTIKTQMYDQGIYFEDATTTKQKSKLEKELYQYFKNSENLTQNIKHVGGKDMSDSDVDKELKGIAEYTASKMLTDPSFQQKIAARSEANGMPNDKGSITALALKDYEDTFLSKGILQSRMEDKVKQIESYIRDVSISSDSDLRRDPILMRLRDVWQSNTKDENKKLLETIVQKGLETGTLNLDKKVFVNTMFSMIDESIYLEGKRLNTSSLYKDFYNKNSSNYEARILRSAFNDDFDAVMKEYMPTKTLKEAIENTPHLKNSGVTVSSFNRDLKEAIESVYTHLPRDFTNDGQTNLKGKAAILASRPNIEWLMIGAFTSVLDKDGVTPEVLKEMFPQVFLASVDQQEAKSILNSPEFKNVDPASLNTEQKMRYEAAQEKLTASTQFLEKHASDPQMKRGLDLLSEYCARYSAEDRILCEKKKQDFLNNNELKQAYGIIREQRTQILEKMINHRENGFTSSVEDVYQHVNKNEMEKQKARQELAIAKQETAPEPQVKPEQPTVAQTQQVVQEQPAQAVQQVAAPVVQQPSEVQVSEPSQQVVDNAVPVQPAVVSNVEPAKNDTQPAVEAPKQVAQVEQTANSDTAIKNTSAFDDKAPVQPATQVEQPKVNTVADDNVNFAALGNAINAHEQAKAMMEVQEQQRLAMEKQAQLEQQKAAQNNHAF